MLRVAGLRVSYEDHLVLPGLDLNVDEGQIVAVLGPSGDGKSTLLRAVAGLVDYTGEVTVGGHSLAGVPAHKRGIGMMFQQDLLFPHLDVAHNVGYGLRQRNPQRVAELLDLVGLHDYGSRSVDSLSGGQAQRVALARALAPSPRLLLLDEPFGALDVVLKRQLVLQVQKVLREQQATVLAVTHDRDEAFTLADRVAVLRQGTIVQFGSPDDLWHAPADDYVAELVGLSVIDGVVYSPDALVIDAQGQWEVLVTGSTYREGRYVVLGERAGRSVRLTADIPPHVGRKIRVTAVPPSVG